MERSGLSGGKIDFCAFPLVFKVMRNLEVL
jgi:hypothetical protein